VSISELFEILKTRILDRKWSYPRINAISPIGSLLRLKQHDSRFVESMNCYRDTSHCNAEQSSTFDYCNSRNARCLMILPTVSCRYCNLIATVCLLTTPNGTRRKCLCRFSFGWSSLLIPDIIWRGVLVVRPNVTVGLGV